MRNSFLSFTFLVLTLMSTSLLAQIETPRPSPLGRVMQNVGFAEVSIEYSRPGVKDREIFGGLVPYGKLWRTGANAATKFTTDRPVEINGNKLQPGEYSIFTIPGEESWTIIFNEDATASTSRYSKEKDVFRFEVRPAILNSKVETLTFNFADVKDNQATIELLWSFTAIRFTLTTEVDKIVMRQIETTMAGVSAQDLYVAARYYLENDKDIKQAYEWMSTAVSKMEEPRFWVLRQYALIQAKMGDYKAAIQTAEQSSKLAAESGNEEYPVLNAASIREWTAKQKGK